MGGAIVYAGYEARTGHPPDLPEVLPRNLRQKLISWVWSTCIAPVRSPPHSFVLREAAANGEEETGDAVQGFRYAPQTPDRIQKSQDEIRSILPAKPEYVVTTSELMM